MNSNIATITAGKGGVGKTLIATSLATSLADRGQKTAVIDYDGGHSVKNTLGVNDHIPVNEIYNIQENLSVVVIDNKKYINIIEATEQGIDFDRYLAQFPRDFGIIPFADMVNQFFGVPTDTPTLQKFSALVASIVSLKKAGCKNIIIDVEPTAGLERLLSNAESMIHSLRNLKNKGVIFLTVIGVQWPEIKKYLKGDYIKNIDEYTSDIRTAVTVIKNARFLLACTPEFGPGEQTFDVKNIIEAFGGKAHMCIVNNIRGEEHEQYVISQIKMHGLPILQIPHNNALHTGTNDRHKTLRAIGEKILDGLHTI